MSNLIFPLNPGAENWGSTFTQKWVVDEAVAASGRRRTIVNQDLPGGVFSLKYLALSKQEKDTLLGFFAQMRGCWDSFWYKDYSYSHAEKQVLPMNSDGTFQCVIAQGAYAESAQKVDNLVVYVNNVATTDYTESNGKITVDAEQGEVKATYDYYFKVAFDENSLSIKEKFEDIFEVSVKLKVVRE